MKRTGGERRERESGYDGELAKEILAFGHITGAFGPHQCPCAHAVCAKEKKRMCSAGLCVRSRLFAHRLRLMSLKGQTPLRKINGVS